MNKKLSTDTYTIDGLGSVALVRSKRARHLRITVRQDKTVRVTLPQTFHLAEAQAFVQEKIPWIQKQWHRIDRLCVPEPQPDLEKIDLIGAQEELFHRLKSFSQLHHLPYRRVSFRRQKTLWGSCSHSNAISLNINLAFLPSDLQDYVMLHELVHTRIKNHSVSFWAYLDKYTNGQARSLAKKLRRYRLQLKY